MKTQLELDLRGSGATYLKIDNDRSYRKFNFLPARSGYFFNLNNRSRDIGDKLKFNFLSVMFHQLFNPTLCSRDIHK